MAEMQTSRTNFVSEHWWFCSIAHFQLACTVNVNSPDLNPLDYHVWGSVLEEFNKLNPKPQTTAELKVVLQAIWNNLPDETIHKSVASFRNRLTACSKAEGGHFKHTVTQCLVVWATNQAPAIFWTFVLIVEDTCAVGHVDLMLSSENRTLTLFPRCLAEY